MNRFLGADLHKSYDLGRRLIEVLHGVSLIGEGEFLSLQGASGTGKSTLLHLLGGLDDLTSGEVFASGQSLSEMSSARLAKWRNDEVGFVFQLPSAAGVRRAGERAAAGTHGPRQPGRVDEAGGVVAGALAWPSA